MGARPLQRLINKQIKEPMIDFLLDDDLDDGGIAIVKLEDDKIKVLVNPMP